VLLGLQGNASSTRNGAVICGWHQGDVLKGTIRTGGFSKPNPTNPDSTNYKLKK